MHHALRHLTARPILTPFTTSRLTLPQLARLSSTTPPTDTPTPPEAAAPTASPEAAAPAAPARPRPLTFATTPHTPTSLKVYVLPTLHPTRFAFHARIPPPRNPVERVAVVVAYVFRKWRYRVSDQFAEPWNALGRWCFRGGEGTVTARAFRMASRVVSRRADDEYFLKSVPAIAKEMEVIYPPSVDVRLVKEQLSLYLADTIKHRRGLYLWSMILPFDLYLSKFLVLAANAFFCYNVFRVNAHWRANTAQQTVQSLIDARRVVWTPSPGFEALVRERADDVTRELGGRWVWRGGDLHDEVVLRVEGEMRLPELARTYRRVRAQLWCWEGEAIRKAAEGEAKTVETAVRGEWQPKVVGK
ncbi:hypothetical protein HDU96_003006 [Phlyctochytrium bullatum]|nr:hypothetical protein HDU96_003006 [Phlyctochytrium bullatum]